jgi:hypothetical protein
VATAALLRDPRAVKLSNQLRGQAAALATRNITSIPPAYIDEVADKMIGAGWTDLKEIDAEKTILEAVQPFPKPGQAGSEGEVEYLLAPYDFWRWTSNGVTMFETPYPQYWFGDTIPLLNTDDGQFTAWMQWIDPPGAPIVILRRRTGGGLNFMRGIKIVGGFIAVAAGLPAIIGEAVLGAELAAAYPAASNAIGQVATRTVLTGGDVESAVRSAATGFAGVEFGGFVGEAVDSAAIGAAAGAATTAALQGSDARAAAVQALISQGVKSVSDFDPTEYDPGEYVYLPDELPAVTGLDYRTLTSVDEITLDDLGLSLDVNDILGNLDLVGDLPIPVDAVIPDEDGNQYTIDGFYVELSERGYIGAIYPDEQGNIRGPDNNIILTSEENIKYLDDPEGLADALRRKIEPLQGETTIPPLTVPNLRPINLPPPAAQTKVPYFDWAKQAESLFKTAASISQSIRQIRGGTFRPAYGTSPYGTARPPVGVPVRQADGSMVVNNGNGTQTVRYPDGRTVTMPSTYTSTGMAGNYGQSLIPGVPNTALLIGGGLVVAALLLSRR